MTTWEHRAVLALAELQSAIGRELLAMATLRTARELGAVTADMQRDVETANKETSEAFVAWQREVK